MGLSKANKELLKLMKGSTKKKEFGTVLSESRFGEVSEFLDTGSCIVNAAMSSDPLGGVPVSKTVMLAGPTSSGKTQIALNAVKRAQDKGYLIVWWDSEHAIDKVSLKSMGIDINSIWYVPEAELEKIKTIFMNLVQNFTEDHKILHIFDSMGAWVTNKTMEDAESGKDAKDMTIPGSKKTLMTLINQECGRRKMGAIIINHTYANVGGYGAATTIAGGGALYMPSVIIEITGKAKWKVKQEQIGNLFKFNIKKSRLSKESSSGTFAMSNDYGLSKYYGLMDYAVDGEYLVECKHGQSAAVQLGIDIEANGKENAEKYLLNDIYTVFESEKVFGRLLKETDFAKYVKGQLSYGNLDRTVAPKADEDEDEDETESINTDDFVTIGLDSIPNEVEVED